MNRKERKGAGVDPTRHWYYISKARAIRALIGKAPVPALVDVGAGRGVIARLLVEAGAAGKATCVDPSYPEDRVGARRTDRVAFVRALDALDAPLVLMIDTLGAEGGPRLLADAARKAAPGTRFVISADAGRFGVEDLGRAAEAAGLEVVARRYFFAALAPFADALQGAVRAMAGDPAESQRALRQAPDWLNRSLVALCDAERAALFPVNRFGGASAFCLAVNPAKLAERQSAA